MSPDGQETADREPGRPDPEQLLARIHADEARAARGRLKVFFGASAGVGKTYAMLEQARIKKRQGVDVVIGWVETHGRKETEALVEGLERIPARPYDYRGTALREFDLDAALARRPQILLLDELAHSNAPGARHAKRWQDAEELLAAGIDVYTTVNVQHIESLNDIIAQTTGVVVRETVPDSILERVEIELVDLTPDDLLQRMKEGKVYIPGQAARATDNFFKKENLIALRELALRQVAEQVDDQMHSYRSERGIRGVWPVAERILVCASSGPEAARVVRAAARMSSRLRAEWIVAYVEKPGDLRQSEADRQRVAKTLRLAEQAGAETITLAGHSVSDEILALARTRNVTKIVVGKPRGSRWRYRLLGSIVDDLIRRSEEIDVYVIRGTTADDPETARLGGLVRHSPSRSYFWAAALVAAITALAHIMFPIFELTNVVMVYLLGVLVIAAVWGRGPSILASIMSVAAFDFFFVPPRLTFAVSDSEYLVTFAVMLAVALLTSTLTVRLRQQAESYRRRQERTAALYRLSRETARGLSTEEVVASTERHIGDVFGCEVWILLPDGEGGLVRAPGITSSFPLDPKELEVARWAFTHQQLAGLGTNTLSGAKALYVPLIGSRGSVGALGMFPSGDRRAFSPEQIQHLEAFADQTALVIERALLVREGEAAKVGIETERLRNLLLSSVSHDLRTPLATITGAASSLLLRDPPLDEETRRELIQSILDEADRLNRLVGNLLTMTSIESGGIKVNKEWQPVEEVIGASLQQMEPLLRNRAVFVSIPGDLPLVQLDGVLIHKVLLNLIDNAVKYTPTESSVEISARAENGGVIVEVADKGPGLPDGSEERVFEKFYRAPAANDRGGVGLGLAICRGIVEAHGGRIWAENRAVGGVTFRFFLPATGTPPALNALESE